VASIALTQHRRLTVWAILGPLSMISTFSLFWFIQPHDHFYFPLLATVGLILSWGWRLKGFLISSAILMINSAIHYQTVEASSQVWLFGSCLSLIMNCFITALCSYEVGDVFLSIPFTTAPDEKSSSVDTPSLKQELDALSQHLTLVKAQKEEFQQQLYYYQELLNMAKQELLTFSASQEKANQEAIQKRQEVDLVREELQTAKEHIQILSREPPKDLLSEKDAVIAKYNRELEQLSRALVEWKDKAVFHENARERSDRDAAAIEQELLFTQEKVEEAQCLLRRTEEEFFSSQAVVQEVQEHRESLIREKKLLEKTLTQLQTELEAAHHELSHNRQAIEAYIATIHSLRDLEQDRMREIHHEKQACENLKLAADKKETLLQKQLEEIGSKWMETLRQNTSLQEQAAELTLLREKHASLQQQMSALAEEKKCLSDAVELFRQEGAASVEARTAKGLYHQLRTQFEEKSMLVDEVRRELFRVQEQVIALLKEKDEMQFGDTPEYKALEQHLVQCEEEWALKEKEYAQEINELNSLVKGLLEQI
jgi:hypothetical protein